MDEDLFIRPSTVSSMMLCPARQTLKTEGEAYVPAEPLVFGSLVHWRIEQYLIGKEALTFDDMSEAFKDIYHRDASEGMDIPKFVSKRRIRELINEAMVAFEEWVGVVLPQLPDEEPLVEHKMQAVVWSQEGSKKVYLTGTPDAIYPKAGVIVDWKTAGRNWNIDKVQSQVQPWAYSLMAEDAGYTINQFHFWVFDRSTESWWLHRHMLDDKHAAQMALAEQAAAFAYLVDSGVSQYTPAGSGWKPRGWHCSPKYCDQWEFCEGKFLVADGQATQPALTLKEKGWK